MILGNEVPPYSIHCCKGVCILYDILMDTQVVGQAEVMREGLYYRFSCKCTPPDESIYRILVSDGNNTKDLGICVPAGEWFCLVSRVPVKHLPGDRLQFTLTSKDKKQTAVPVATDEPFPYLDMLETAGLQEVDGVTEIIIDPVQDQQGSDLIQESPHKWEQP